MRQEWKWQSCHRMIRNRWSSRLRSKEPVNSASQSPQEPQLVVSTKIPRRSGALRTPLFSFLTAIGSAAVVSLLIALLVRHAVGILVLLTATVRLVVVVVGVLIGLLLRRTETVSGLAILPTVVHAVGIANLLGTIVAPVIATISRATIAVSAVTVSGSIPILIAAPSSVATHFAVTAVVSGLIG